MYFVVGFCDSTCKAALVLIGPINSTCFVVHNMISVILLWRNLIAHIMVAPLVVEYTNYVLTSLLHFNHISDVCGYAKVERT